MISFIVLTLLLRQSINNLSFLRNMHKQSIISIDNSRFDHLHPLTRHLRLKIISLLLVSYCKHLTLNHNRSVLLQLYLPFLLASLRLIIHQLRSRIKNQHTLSKITKKHLLLHHTGKQHLLHLLTHYISQ